MLQTLKWVFGRPLARRARRLARSFLDQARDARRLQDELLQNLLRRHADSQFGRDHHFEAIRGPEDYRRNVPIGDYTRLEPYIDRVRNGETQALFGRGTKVLMFAMTSGTTNRPKTIPVTAESLRDYREGWTIWGIQAFDAHPEMLRRGLKPILQIASDWREKYTAGGIPCGAITGLTASMQSPLVRSVYCMPACASRIKDISAKYYVALRSSVHLDLGTIIAANPATILAMVRLGDQEKETLIRDLHDGTLDPKWEIPTEVRQQLGRRVRIRRRQAARRLEEIVNRTGRLLPRDYWPDLLFLSNWTGGTMRAYLRGYPEWFGERPVRDVGLIASEGRMSIPVEDGTPAGILDVRHHYFEFIPEDQAAAESPQTVAACDLLEGQNYFILLTTAGGLYRYNIHDLVRCVGFHGEAPIIEFLNKGAHFSSLTGEKLSEHQVIAAVQSAQLALGLRLNSYLLLPSWGEPPHYELLVESCELAADATASQLARVVDEQLRHHNIEYASKRDTLRLGPVRTMTLPEGSWARFQQQRLARSGGTVEQYKQPHLIPELDAVEAFRVRELVSQ
jgi:hypothetical protein